jgi:hypothetical protein
MTHPTRITQTEWETLTNRIYHDVGSQIRETRKIQFHLRFILAASLVGVMSGIYMIALITA